MSHGVEIVPSGRLERQHPRQRTRDAPPEPDRHLLDPAVVLDLEISSISGEALVSAVARERDGDVPAGSLTDVVRRYRGGIPEGLVEKPHQIGQDLQRRWGDHDLVVIGSQMLRNDPSILQLRVVRLLEADAERTNGRRAQLAHQRDHDTGIEPAAQKGPEGHIAHQASLRRATQQEAEVIDRFRLRRRGAGRPELQLPVALAAKLTIFHDQQVCRRKPANILQDGLIPDGEAAGQVLVQGLRVDLSFDPAVRQ